MYSNRAVMAFPACHRIGKIEYRASLGIRGWEAGLIKAALALQHEEIPPSLHFLRPNPQIPWEQLPIVVPVSPAPWSRGQRIRRAGVSSFGFSGTNAHVVLEEAPLQMASESEKNRLAHVFAISAKNEVALAENAKRYTQASGFARISLADACCTVNTGRGHFSHRFACMTKSRDELQTQLEAFTSGELATGAISGKVHGPSRTEVVFLYPGQGAQYPGMTKRLYETEPTFREALDRCAKALRGHLKQPLLEVIFDCPNEKHPSTTLSTHSPRILPSSTRQPRCGDPGAFRDLRWWGTVWESSPQPVQPVWATRRMPFVWWLRGEG